MRRPPRTLVLPIAALIGFAGIGFAEPSADNPTCTDEHNNTIVDSRSKMPQEYISFDMIIEADPHGTCLPAKAGDEIEVVWRVPKNRLPKTAYNVGKNNYDVVIASSIKLSKVVASPNNGGTLLGTVLLNEKDAKKVELARETGTVLAIPRQSMYDPTISNSVIICEMGGVGQYKNPSSPARIRNGIIP